VTQGDLEKELPATESDSFDVAVLSLTLQAVRRPDRVLAEMGRVATRQIVSLPNFGHWRLRADLTLGGRMPVSELLPYQWFDTPNIHLCTLADFEALVEETGSQIEKRVLLDGAGRPARGLRSTFPNLLAEGAVYSLVTP
jgi:methionine biosynthesis protein MetW